MPHIKELPAARGAGGSGGEDKEGSGTRGFKPPPKKKEDSKPEEEDEELEEEEEEETETIVEIPKFGMEDVENALTEQAKKERETEVVGTVG